MQCLKQQGLKPTDITEIEVNPGPGSFTGSRVGVTIANALAFALGIQVNSQNPPIEPIYSSPPGIILSKK
jgi:tRNA A37 threonylcarbamoyladenosine modification protein TsaB